MMRYGIVRRSVFGEKPPVEVTYALTAFGRRFIRILDEVRRLQEAVDPKGMPGSAPAPKDVARMSRRRKPTARTGPGHRA